jgi:hypothetical protein
MAALAALLCLQDTLTGLLLAWAGPDAAASGTPAANKAQMARQLGASGVHAAASAQHCFGCRFMTQAYQSMHERAAVTNLVPQAEVVACSRDWGDDLLVHLPVLYNIQQTPEALPFSPFAQHPMIHMYDAALPPPPAPCDLTLTVPCCRSCPVFRLSCCRAAASNHRDSKGLCAPAATRQRVRDAATRKADLSGHAAAAAAAEGLTSCGSIRGRPRG